VQRRCVFNGLVSFLAVRKMSAAGPEDNTREDKQERKDGVCNMISAVRCGEKRVPDLDDSSTAEA